MRRIYISDYSLQVSAEEQKLLFREKTATAASLAKLRVDAIDLPAIKKYKEDSIIYKTIATSVNGTELCVPVGEFGPEESYETIKGASKPCLQICFPISPIQMEYKAGLKEKPLLAKISEEIQAASAICKTEFVAEDATRSEERFLVEACKNAQEAGAERITLEDASGESLSYEVTELIKAAVSNVDIPVYFKPSNRLGLALSNAVAAIQAGCDGIKTAATGEDALHTDAFAVLMQMRGNDLGIRCGYDESLVHSTCKAIAKGATLNTYADTKLMQAEYGENADIFLDAGSSIDDVKRASKLLGYDLSGEDLGKVHEALKLICEKKASVGRKEFEAIISSSAMQVPSTYQLDSYSINTSNLTMSMAYICLTKGDEKLEGITTGDGPIDSAFRAIDLAIGYHYELDDFQLQALTEGKESLGSTIVKLRSSSGKLYSGMGLSSDIIGAGIKAYINALNKIAYEEQQ